MSIQQLIDEIERALRALAVVVVLFALTGVFAITIAACGDTTDDDTPPSFDDKVSAVDTGGSDLVQSRSDSDFQTVGNGTVHVQVPTWGYKLVRFDKLAGQQVTFRLANIRGGGDPDIDLIGHWTPQVGWSAAQYSSLNWGTRDEVISFRPNEDGPYYLALYGYSGSGLSADLTVQGAASGSSPSAPRTSGTAYSPSQITSTSSTSVWATTENPFRGGLVGECTWGTYGRVMELVAAGQLPARVGTAMRNAFSGRYGRDARNWPSLLGGTWVSTTRYALPLNLRKKGLLAVWVAGTHGHVGFVEEVNADKSQYRLSDFNRGLDHAYRARWYHFEGTDDGLLGTYPTFLDLDPLR